MLLAAVLLAGGQSKPKRTPIGLEGRASSVFVHKAALCPVPALIPLTLGMLRFFSGRLVFIKQILLSSKGLPGGAGSRGA